jgi:hypothetical protein
VIAKRNSKIVGRWNGTKPVFPVAGSKHQRTDCKTVRHAHRKKDKRISDAPIYWFFVVAALAYLLGTWLWSFVPLASWQR